MTRYVTVVALTLVGGCMLACGGGGSDALGIAAECTADTDCSNDGTLVCLTGFSAGYCGLTGCTDNDGCPADAWCVTHTDGVNYCFRSCTDKPECNANRTPANEANCSAKMTRADGVSGTKACVPPSG